MPPLLILAFFACNAPDPAWRVDEPRVRIAVDQIDFGAVALGTSAEASLTLDNRGGGAGEVAFALDDPRFTLERERLSVGPLASAELRLWFTPDGGQDVEATLQLAAPEPLELPLFGRTNPDGDADGHQHLWLGGDDCDDADPLSYPGAAESWYDGVDSACDGGSDFDADADGHDRAPEGDDCDDADPLVAPGAAEFWYDGVDSACDGGSDFDADADGHDRTPEGDDCDDTDPRSLPGAAESWYDGVDSACDGGSDFDADADGHDRTPEGDDCDDADPARSPSAPDLADALDNDCDGLLDEGALRYGDVVFTEFLAWPTADPDDEYIELFNTTSAAIRLDGWSLSASGGAWVFPSGSAIEAGDWLVLCRTRAALMNAWCDLSVSGAFSLNERTDALALAAGALVLDAAGWDESWGIAQSAAWSTPSLDADENDSADAWCAASSALPADRGTPGAANDGC